MLGVGGWNMESDEFSAMVKEKKTRLVFIYHAIKFLRHHGFDGLDLGIFLAGHYLTCKNY